MQKPKVYTEIIDGKEIQVTVLYSEKTKLSQQKINQIYDLLKPVQKLA